MYQLKFGVYVLIQMRLSEMLVYQECKKEEL